MDDDALKTRHLSMEFPPDSKSSNLAPYKHAKTATRWSIRLWILALLLSSIAIFKSSPLKTNIKVPMDAQNGWGTDEVSFDSYSLSLRGQRVFVNSGEFHTFRLPVPDLWPDILQKFKAAGLNAVSLYTHMAIINPSRGVLDFDDWRALAPFYEACKAAGIWVVLRPGPYINAETTAGGIAHWATSEVAGTLRTNASDWHEVWKVYVDGIIKESAPYQITHGGPIIAIQLDNEYEQWLGGEYFEDLKDAYHNSEIVVPLTYNDPSARRNFINGTGAVDLYGMDSYPQRFDCSNPHQWNPVDLTYHQYHIEVNPSQPWYIPEFQAGAFDAWGPTSPGYGACNVLTGPDFMSVFNLQLWASNAKLINYYMVYGGTSWGGIPFPGVYTSYDYGSAIDEQRALTPKYDELKLQGVFLRSSPEFYKTDWLGDSSTGAIAASNPEVFVTQLQNPDSKANFYIVRHNNSSSTDSTDFRIDVATSQGTLSLPQVISPLVLGGRQSKLIVTDYAFGASSRVLYSTAQVFYAGIIDGRDVLFLYGDASQQHEAAIEFTGTPNKVQLDTDAFSTQAGQSGVTIVSFLDGIEGLVTVYDSDTQLVLYSDRSTAATFWAPTLAGPKENDLANFWSFGTNSSILVGGPYLVRSASLEDGRLALQGDLKDEARLMLIAPKGIRSITWNGQVVAGDVQLLGSSVLRLSLAKRATAMRGIEVPKLTAWRYKDSLPEISKDYDDARWTLANHTETNIPQKPYYGDGRMLYGCDYGFCENTVLWRGHFTGVEGQSSVNLSINGGEAFAATVWLNDAFMNTSYGNSTNNRNILEETDDVFTFPEGSLNISGDNVITIVQDNMGLNETEGDNPDSSKGPRGVRGFKLNKGHFEDWKVQGKLGGYLDFPDKTRGVLNEGGLFGERAGYHLPGFDTSDWAKRDLSAGLPNGKAGVGFFVTTFKLDIPTGFDVPISFVFKEPLGQPYRVFLFVNGWMMGKRVGNLGPQAKFPIQEGILDYRGENTVAVALWAMEEDADIHPELEIMIDGVYDGGVGQVRVNNPGYEQREVY
ncbi:glycoside hydrolase family 35 protein [Cylindrobasidium torrendii FP15055 ss-10]|uniref:beta-galactosidase n=1 Tax=Cylindrobasidium torrendii FP15055 ss-10 TaxID=1314674 RepID=A0A0D7B9U1_9AGAR|nr:glycoside hydrolase family 35 protein [Cylindrobasidium torrendii FP15055 ss-10]